MITNKTLKTLIDFTLGDGSIRCEGRMRNAIFKMDHSIKQREYLWHKASILKEYGIEGRERIQDRNLKGKTYQIISYTTKTNPIITTAHKWMYNKGRKSIDKSLIRQLDVQSLAYWFMDDGSGPKTNKSSSLVNGKRYTYIYPEYKIERYTLSTYNCTLDELHLLQDWLLSFGIQSHLKLDKRAKTCLGSFISIDGIENKNNFRSLIEPYIIPSMKYKITGLHSFKGLKYSAETTERESSLIKG